MIGLLTALLTVAFVGTAAGMGAHHHGPHSGSGSLAGPINPPAANEFSPDVGGVWEASRDIDIEAIHSVHLPTNELLVWGLDNANGGVRMKIYDQTTGDLTEIESPKPAFCAGHAFLSDGRVVILGGKGLKGGGRYTIYDPFTRTFTEPKQQNARRYYPTLTSLPDGRIITFSGAGGGARTPEIYDPTTDAWTKLGCSNETPPVCRDANINFHWYSRVAVSPAGPLFALPGAREWYLHSLDLTTERWTQWKIGPGKDGRFKGGPTVYYAPGKMMKAGGDKVSRRAASAETTIIDFTDAANPTYRITNPMSIARNRNNMTILADGMVLSTGGIRGAPPGEDPNVYNAEVWDPATETWTLLNAMRNTRVYHSTAVLMRDGSIFSAGGEPKQHTSQIFHPPYLYKGPRPVITSAPEDVYYEETFEVLTPDPASIAAVNLLKLGAVTHTYDQGQLIARLPFIAGVDRLTVDGPGDEYDAPPGYYQLFLISTDGVPSIAEYVKLEYEDVP